MMKQKPLIWIGIALLALSLACRAPVNAERVKTGALQQEEILVPAPNAGETIALELNFGAGEIEINPGGSDSVLKGQATFNVAALKPEVKIDGSLILLTSGDTDRIPNFHGDLRNEWDLELGTMPLELRILAGAYQGRFELGGLSIEKLTVQDGASDVRLEFSEPNQVEMSRLSYETGASNVRLEGLGNANLRQMEFRGGAGAYTLDFSGTALQDAEISIEAGISSVTLIVPEDVNVRLTFEGGLSSVNTGGQWRQSGGRYLLEAVEEAPTLTISVKMGAGELNLENP